LKKNTICMYWFLKYVKFLMQYMRNLIILWKKEVKNVPWSVILFLPNVTFFINKWQEWEKPALWLKIFSLSFTHLPNCMNVTVHNRLHHYVHMLSLLITWPDLDLSLAWQSTSWVKKKIYRETTMPNQKHILISWISGHTLC